MLGWQERAEIGEGGIAGTSHKQTHNRQKYYTPRRGTTTSPLPLNPKSTTMSPATTLTLTLLSLLLTSTPTLSQTFYQNGCLRLSGSTACPGFSSAYVNPANLSNAFPFFADVTDVASFDAGVYTYLSDANQYRATKFEGQLGCTNSSQAMLRYSRTVLCSSWVNSRWSIECFNLYSTSRPSGWAFPS